MKQRSNILQRKEPELLLIATSARAMLESALRGGTDAAIIDGFCDRDAMQCASTARQVALREEGGLDDLSLADAIKQMSQRYAKTLKTVVVGSGTEGCEASLKAIKQSGLQCLGNDLQWHQSHQRVHCESMTDKIMPVPNSQAPYLYKSANGSGGVHIYYADGESPKMRGDYYRQSYLPLMSISHLFLADGEQIETIGFSTQWHSKHDPMRPFCYGGAINAHYLSESCIAQAEDFAKRFDLRGINNIDYLYDGATLYFLELNPRPSATMTLYDSDYPEGLLHAHIKACRGEGLEKRQISSEIRTFAVFYADKAIYLPSDFEWLDELKDVPAADDRGYYFEKNAPICTVYASADNACTALSKLQQRVRELQSRIELTAELDTLAHQKNSWFSSGSCRPIEEN